MALQPSMGAPATHPPATREWRSFVRYAGVRVLMLFLTAIAGVYVTIIVANLGGHVDDIMRSMIIESVGIGLGRDPEVMKMPLEQREEFINQAIAAAEEAAGLNEPFLIRSWRWLSRGITLDLGASDKIRSIYSSGRDRYSVRLLILERLPVTLLLFGATNLLTFLVCLWVAPRIARNYGSVLDKVFVALAPISSAPSWFHGLFLIALFAGQLHLLPFGGMRPSPPPDSRLLYALGVLRHSVLPVLAIFLSTFFQAVYAWRTFFLIHAHEDYVDIAKAKGIPPIQVERRHIIRPTLPPILTNLALVVLSAWSGSVMLETLFSWPGLGQLFFLSLRRFDTKVVIGLTVIYAYLLLVTVFILDIVYGLVDPRVRLGGAGAPHLRAKRSARLSLKRIAFLLGRLPQEISSRARSALGRFTRLEFPPRHAERVRPPTIRRHHSSLHGAIRELIRYPSAIVGVAVILLMLGSIVYTISAVPYEAAIAHWRGDLDAALYPKNAQPIWFDLFTRTRLPRSLNLSSLDGTASKQVLRETNTDEIVITFIFDYPFDAFPQELFIDFSTTYLDTPPHVTMTWHTPDDRKVRLGQAVAVNHYVYRFAHDSRLVRRLGGVPPEHALFADPTSDTPIPLKGTYELKIRGLCFDDASDLDARFVLHGTVFGLAGTDSRRRDLSVALLWGVPTAMGFGLTAAVAATLTTMVIAAIGAWYSGLVDGVIQRISEVNLILPTFPILAMVTLFYTTSILNILIVAVLLGIFGSGIKNYRAMFLQIKAAPYIEAARAYGASNARIVGHYLIPRIIPLLIPQMIALVPSYVFLEASLAFLGLSDPHLPTWGKVINDAYANNALSNNHSYWILQPAFLLLLTSLAFAMVGFALDRVFNPRLREM